MAAMVGESIWGAKGLRVSQRDDRLRLLVFLFMGRGKKDQTVFFWCKAPNHVYENLTNKYGDTMGYVIYINNNMIHGVCLKI